ncbi:restriction endonuclease subunit S [Listeria sp. FSL L7-0233]|uniref:restriction endonuclease subunit S n=1 Tax=Listeria cossartiae TaxID=2838249 RepID=UPI001629E5D3|nr:restriction endonuclease subunit S [Listeria cossartiae]MBC2182881.1 restriction endonuclease subunit S [Listeria cossartiae subsp. cossartiae]
MKKLEKGVPVIRFKGFYEAWEQRKLGEELNLLKDGTHGTHKDVKDGFYLLSAKNIKNGQIIIDELIDRKISEEEYNTIHKNFSLKKGDVLLTIVGSIGETSIIKNPTGITFQRSVAYLRPAENIESQFLFTLISSSQFQDELKKRQVISAQPGIYLGDLSVIPIKVPNIKEQQKIGDFFKQLDDTIALHQCKLEALKLIKKGFLQQMFPKRGENIPKIRFDDFDDNWEQCTLGEFLKESKIKGSNGSLAKKLTVKLWRKGVVPKEEIYTGSSATQYYIRKMGQFIYGKLDFLNQAFGIVPLELDGYESTLDSPAFDIEESINETFLLEYVSLVRFYKYQGNIANGSRRAKRIHTDTFFEMPIPLPNSNEQQKIGTFSQQIDDLIALQQTKLEKLSSLKRFYLKNMFI